MRKLREALKGLTDLGPLLQVESSPLDIAGIPARSGPFQMEYGDNIASFFLLPDDQLLNLNPTRSAVLSIHLLNRNTFDKSGSIVPDLRGLSSRCFVKTTLKTGDVLGGAAAVEGFLQDEYTLTSINSATMSSFGGAFTLVSKGTYDALGKTMSRVGYSVIGQFTCEETVTAGTLDLTGYGGYFTSAKAGGAGSTDLVGVYAAATLGDRNWAFYGNDGNSFFADSLGLGVGGTDPADIKAKLQINGGVAVVDGMTAPDTITGYGQVYIDTADGDAKIKFGDGTVVVVGAGGSTLTTVEIDRRYALLVS